jgi:hypothetical protein
MHRDPEHFHPYDVSRGHVGHNHAPSTAQWQTPHAPDAPPQPSEHRHEADIDLVEKAFTDAFPKVTDPTSFLRLAGIPFTATAGDGAHLSLLRVAQENVVDIGALAPQLGGAGFRYDPLPAAMVGRRERLAFVYFDGAAARHLGFEEARALAPATPQTD